MLEVFNHSLRLRADPSRVVVRPFHIAWQSANGSGPFGTNDTGGSYGPLTMQIQLGNETVSASGGGITVFNNAGPSSSEDGYDVRPSQTFNKQLFGRNLRFFRFLLVDDSGTMFTNTDLPLSPAFAAIAGFQQTELDFQSNVVVQVLGQPTPFTLTLVPEPSAIALLAMGFLMLISWRICRR